MGKAILAWPRPMLRMSVGWRSRKRVRCLSSFASLTGNWDGLRG